MRGPKARGRERWEGALSAIRSVTAAAAALALGELAALAGAGLPVLLALLHARIAREEAFLAHRPAQRLVEPHQRARDPELHRARLPGEPAAGGRGVNVVARRRVRGHERSLGVLDQRRPHEVLRDGPAVD